MLIINLLKNKEAKFRTKKLEILGTKLIKSFGILPNFYANSFLKSRLLHKYRKILCKQKVK